MKLPESIKVIFLGNTQVGKTSIINRFVENTFDIEEIISKSVAFVSKDFFFTSAKKAIRFNIWDTAGQESYRSLASLYYKNAIAAVVVYDLNSRDSYEGAKIWIEELHDKGPNDIIIILVGNKADLICEELNYEEAYNYAEKIKGKLILASAKENTNIDNIFETIGDKLACSKDTPIISKPIKIKNENEINVSKKCR